MNVPKTIVLTLLVLIGLTSCSREPKFSTTPNISFEKIQQFSVYGLSGNLNVDSVDITIHYQDGDGDLGLTQADYNMPPWNAKYNGEVKTLVKRGGQYIPLIDILGHEVDNSWGFSATGKTEGVIENPYIIFQPVSYPLKDTVKFMVRVIDKAMHSSQWVETTPVIINRQN